MLFRNETPRRLWRSTLLGAGAFACLIQTGLAAPASDVPRLALSDLPHFSPPNPSPGSFGEEPAQAPGFDEDGTDEDALSPGVPPSDDVPAGDLPAADEGASAPDAAGTAILYDPGLLPDPAARMRQLIIEAAATGDIEALRPLIGIGPDRTRLAINAIEDDPIDYLRVSSGDGEGRELLAIVLDVLDAGYVAVREEGEETLYLWPYFFAMPLEDLSPPQLVELFRVVTAGDYEEMQVYGGYNFYRIGITESGEWAYFLAGD